MGEGPLPGAFDIGLLVVPPVADPLPGSVTPDPFGLELLPGVSGDNPPDGSDTPDPVGVGSITGVLEPGLLVVPPGTIPLPGSVTPDPFCVEPLSCVPGADSLPVFVPDPVCAGPLPSAFELGILVVSPGTDPLPVSVAPDAFGLEPLGVSGDVPLDGLDTPAPVGVGSIKGVLEPGLLVVPPGTIPLPGSVTPDPFGVGLLPGVQRTHEAQHTTRNKAIHETLSYLHS